MTLDNELWWQGGESVWNERLVDFFLDLQGIEKARNRLEGEPLDPHSVIECTFWIAAASEASGFRSQHQLLDGFYWLRNKGIHETRVAMGQIEPGAPKADRRSVHGLLDCGPISTRWRKIYWGTVVGGKASYNAALAGKVVEATIEEAYQLLLAERDRIIRVLGGTPPGWQRGIDAS